MLSTTNHNLELFKDQTRHQAVRTMSLRIDHEAMRSHYVIGSIAPNRAII